MDRVKCNKKLLVAPLCVIVLPAKSAASLGSSWRRFEGSLSALGFESCNSHRTPQRSKCQKLVAIILKRLWWKFQESAV